MMQNFLYPPSLKLLPFCPMKTEMDWKSIFLHTFLDSRHMYITVTGTPDFVLMH